MKKTILIVEDDPFTRQFYSYLFPQSEYQLIQTENGDEAIASLNEGNISLIIMDISLKNTFIKEEKYDGLELTSLIKKNEKFKEIPLIVISAYKKQSNNLKDFEESLADDYIVKPITDFKLFLDRVKELIK